MENSTVRVRPLRFAFLVDPKNKSDLQAVFEANSALWGGLFNFIVPLFKSLPQRYRPGYGRPLNPKAMLRGLVEGFQPDFLVETKAGQAGSHGLDFPQDRIIPLSELTNRVEGDKCKIGIDLRSICDDLYDTTFRFVQRHPPEVVIPISTEECYKLFLAATFGSLPESGRLGEVANIYLKSLEGKRETIKPADFPRLYGSKYLFPLRVTTHKLETSPNSWSTDAKLFWMDEASPYDLIEFWNLRALGWKIRPLPAKLAPSLTEYCQFFIKQNYRAYSPPSNGFHHTTFMCAKSQSVDEMRGFMSILKLATNDTVALDHRFPRIWAEWGRSADHAEPQTVTHSKPSVEANIIGEGLYLTAVLPDFLKRANLASPNIACANVLETVQGGAPVIPWKKNVAAGLTQNFGDEKTWISREGIVIFAGDYPGESLLRVPSALNIFGAFAESAGYSLTMSPAGRTCEQIIAAVGGLSLLGIVARSSELLSLLDRMAHEDVEVELEIEEGAVRRKKRVVKEYAMLASVQEAVSRSNPGHEHFNSHHLNALLRQNVLKLGMALCCTECGHTSWFSLESLSSKLNCPRCSTEFSFPSGSPPGKDSWAYRVSGPFAAGNYAHGAYCVAAALHFLTKKVTRQSTWLPSFDMKGANGKKFEADFGMFAAPNRNSHTSSPHLILGECKSYNRFDEKDFARARESAKIFPGAVLCFCTFNESLNRSEIRALRSIAKKGWEKLDVAKQMNPVLVLTGRELFGQFRIGEFNSLYGDKSQKVRMMLARGDIQEICSFTQQTYLGMESYYDWRDRTNKRKTRLHEAAKTRRAKKRLKG